MGVAPTAVLAGRQRRDKVPGGHYGVGGQSSRFQALARRHDPRKRLLHQVFHDLHLTDAGGDDPPQQRCQLENVVMPQLTGRLTSAQAPRSWGRGTSSRRAAFQDDPALGEASENPGACVMSSRHESVLVEAFITWSWSPRAGLLGNRET